MLDGLNTLPDRFPATCSSRRRNHPVLGPSSSPVREAHPGARPPHPSPESGQTHLPAMSDCSAAGR